MQPLLQWKSKRYYIIWVCVCTLRYSECSPLTHIANCVLSGYTIFFSRYLINGTTLKKKLLNTQSVLKFSLQRLSETLFILSKTEWDKIGIVYLSSSNEPVNLVRFFWNFNFLYTFPKNTHLSNFMKIRPVGADVFHANKRTEGQTDRRDDSNSRFSQFCERV